MAVWAGLRRAQQGIGRPVMAVVSMGSVSAPWLVSMVPSWVCTNEATGPHKREAVGDRALAADPPTASPRRPATPTQALSVQLHATRIVYTNDSASVDDRPRRGRLKGAPPAADTTSKTTAGVLGCAPVVGPNSLSEKWVGRAPCVRAEGGLPPRTLQRGRWGPSCLRGHRSVPITTTFRIGPKVAKAEISAKYHHVRRRDPTVSVAAYLIGTSHTD